MFEFVKFYSSVGLIAGISSSVLVVLLLVVAVLAYRQYQDKQARARVGPRRPPKFGPSFDYCEGYYGDDRPASTSLLLIKCYYYFSIVNKTILLTIVY